jgi:hypothetical protein
MVELQGAPGTRQRASVRQSTGKTVKLAQDLLAIRPAPRDGSAGRILRARAHQ